MRRARHLLPTSFALLASSIIGLWAGAVNAQGQIAEVQNYKRGKIAATTTGSQIGMSDVFEFLDVVYMGQAPAVDCDEAYDVDDNGSVGVGDVILMLQYLFTSGAAPTEPYAACGVDVTADTLDCVSYPFCDPTLIELPPTEEQIAEYATVQHVLRRITYGQTPALLDRIWDMPGNAEDYIDEQLAPEEIDESGNLGLATRLSSLQPDRDLEDLYRLQIQRATYSERQLVEVLTNFWENHFNTNVFTVSNWFREQKYSGSLGIYNEAEALETATYFEHVENQAFRELALGSFEDLLLTSATDVTMLIYLDSVANIAGDPNENFAREVLELHTVGVDNGYDQTDVEQLARVFTGWSVCLKEAADADDPHADCHEYVSDPVAEGLVWAFHFDPDKHDYGAKTIFHTLPSSQQYSIAAGTEGDGEGGLSEGIEFLKYLATLGRTAEYVSTKLCQRLVSDEPPGGLVADCIDTWADTDGDMREVVRTILTSDEFLGTEYRLNKVRTPMEYTVSIVRAFNGNLSSSANDVLNTLTLLGNLPFNHKTPDGYPEDGSDQLGSSKQLEMLRFASLLFGDSNDLSFDRLGRILRDRGVNLNSVEAIVEFWLSRLFIDQHDEVDVEIAQIFLSTNDDGEEQVLQSWANVYNERLGKFLTFVASLPQHILQ